MSLQIKHSLQKLQERVVKKSYQVQIRAGSICSLIWPAYSTLETTGINEHQSLHMSPISLARCFTLLCKGLSPGETAVKIKFQEEDKKNQESVGQSATLTLVSTGKEPTSH